MALKSRPQPSIYELVKPGLKHYCAFMRSSEYLIWVGAALKERREKLKLTHEDVAEHADINVNYYSRIERGEINTTINKLFAISLALDTTPSTILRRAEKARRR